MATERIQSRIERLLDQLEQVTDDRDWVRVQDLASEILHWDSENIEAKEFLALSQKRTRQLFLGQLREEA